MQLIDTIKEIEIDTNGNVVRAKSRVFKAGEIKMTKIETVTCESCNQEQDIQTMGLYRADGTPTLVCKKCYEEYKKHLTPM